MWVNQLIAIMQIHRDRLLRITLIERKTCNDFLNFSGPREKYLTRMTRQLKNKNNNNSKKVFISSTAIAILGRKV